MRRQQMAKPRPLGGTLVRFLGVGFRQVEGSYLFAPVTSTRKVVGCSGASDSCWTCIVEVRL